MGQKSNSNLFNLVQQQKKQSSYIEKRLIDQSVFLKIDLEIKNFIREFFKTQEIIMNRCKIVYLKNSIYIYIPYYQKVKNAYNIIFTKSNEKKIKIIKNRFNTKSLVKMKQLKKYVLKRTIFNNWKLTNISKFSEKKIIQKISNISEVWVFIETLFTSLKNLTFKKFKVFLILDQKNKKLHILKQKLSIIKKKQKLINLRKYKQHKFFEETINLLYVCLSNKNSSKMLAKYLAFEFQILRRHNYFLRFIKNTLILFNKQNLFSKIWGIKIQIKGRLNGNSRAKNRIIQVAKKIPLLTKNLNIDHFEEISFSQNGTFGIKVWIWQK